MNTDNTYSPAGRCFDKLMSAPIIRLEVDFMKSVMRQHLSEQAVKMDSMVQQAVEAYCSEGNLRVVLGQAVREALDSAVREEVRDFFSGTRAGRLAVREKVIRYLDTQARWHGDDKEELKDV